jgi:hypothetical protein
VWPYIFNKLPIIALLIFSATGISAQHMDSLRITMESIKTQIEKQKPIKTSSGTKSGWVFKYDDCSCFYQKSRTYNTGAYALVEWEINFDLADIQAATLGAFEDPVLLLESSGGKKLIKTLQHKTYRDHEVEVTSVHENRVIIDISNRTSVSKLIESFNAAIRICATLE